MRKALVTIAGGAYFERMAALTHPTLEAYAEKVGADFLVWSDLSGYQVPEYKKTEVRGLLDHYDRVLYVDTDVIIRLDAPDIFSVVPEDSLGALDETPYYDRRIGTLRFMEHVGFDSTKWDGHYYNAGIFVCSRCHQDMFVRPPVEYNHFADQTWFNTMIADRQVRVFSLPYRFNRVLAFDRFYGEDRLDSWFLHYAGVQVVLSREERLELIAHDLEMWRRAAPAYAFPHHVVFVVEGDLGEQVAAEGAIRYAREVLCRGDDLVVVSRLPEIFAHLGLPLYPALEQVPSEAKYLKRYTLGDNAASWRRHQVHATTAASLAALGVELPMTYKRPRLVVGATALASLERKAAGVDLTSLVLVHPARGSAAITFPADVWQAYVDALVAAGYAVAVVGDRSLPELNVVEFDRSRYLDLVDALSIAELIALVSRARVVVASDSPVVQIAGAFDGWIGLIATWRHPEYVLPWREGAQSYRAKHLERAPLYEDYFHEPSGGEQPRLDACDPARLRQCLPDARAVVEFVATASV